MTLLTVSEEQLEGLLKAGPLEIPDYQRAFTWKEKDWRPLWEDIESLARAGIGSSSAGTHFLGPVVLTQTPPAPVDVIDGQQRLTYLTVLLIALLEVADEIDGMGTGSAWRFELERCLYESTSGHPRLKLNHSDPRVDMALHDLVLNYKTKEDREKYLEAHLPGTEKTPQGRIRRALEQSYENIAGFMADSSHTRYQAGTALLRAVTEGLLVVQINVKDSSKVFDVFERLNARGVPLGQGDLIRNLLLNRAEKVGERTAVDAELKRLTKTVGYGKWLSLADSFHLVYVSRWGWTPASNLLAAYGSTLDDPSMTPLKLVQFVRSQVDLLREILDPPSSWKARQRHGAQLLVSFLRNKFSLSLPLVALSVFGESSSEFLWSLDSTNAYVFRSFVLGGEPLTNYTERMANWATTLRDAATKATPPGGPIPTKVALDDIAAEMSTKVNERSLEEDLAAYVPRTQKMGFYIAYMLEVGEARRTSKKTTFAGKHPDLQSPNQHLEHILPTNAAAAPGWALLALTPDSAKRISSRWGNMLVLPGGLNSSIKDGSHAKKVIAYRSGPAAALLLPKTIPPGPAPWDEECIKSRERFLAANVAPHSWEIPKP